MAKPKKHETDHAQGNGSDVAVANVVKFTPSYGVAPAVFALPHECVATADEQGTGTLIHVPGVTVKGAVYLLTNGFNQSLTDAAAATKEQKEKLLRDAGHVADADAVRDQKKPTLTEAGKAVLDGAAATWRQERLADIIAGSVGTRVGGGPRLDPLQRIIRDIADERLVALAASLGVAMPKGDTLTAARDKVLERFGDDIRAEAEARMAKNAADAAALGDIFA